jgi:hypothetical protein
VLGGRLQLNNPDVTVTWCRLQPWYAEQPFSVDDWVADSPVVILTPLRSDEADRARSR